MVKISKKTWFDLLSTPSVWMLWGIREAKPSELKKGSGFVSPTGVTYVADIDPTSLNCFVSANGGERV